MRVPRLLFALLLVSSAMSATTFLIPSDRALVTGSGEIAVVTAGESHSQWAPNHGWIETVTTMHVDEAIKGPMQTGDTMHVTELGGIVDGAGYAVAGSPSYQHGEQMLLFLGTNSRGEWTAKNMVIGKFGMTQDGLGRGLLVRDAGELNGEDTDGSSHREPVRLQAAFLQFVRDTANGRVANAEYVVPDPRPRSGLKVVAEAQPPFIAAPNSYLVQVNGSFGVLGLRRETFPAPVVFYSNGAQPGALNSGITAITLALGAWSSGPGSNVHLDYGGTTTITNALNHEDGVNTIQLDDPNNEIPGFYTGSDYGGDVIATTGSWYAADGPNCTHLAGGVRYYTIISSDVVVQNGLFGFSENGFDDTIAHEVGHTLGFRHSNDLLFGGEEANTSVMNSFIYLYLDPYGAVLQDWDKHALHSVYSPDMTACHPPEITVQPQGAALGTTTATLSVTAIGDAPQYQWYSGNRGNTAQPIPGGTAATITVQPAVTTAYWVRISNACNLPADSDTVSVVVKGCPAVTLSSQSLDTLTVVGKAVTLNVAASGAGSYQWYSGTSGVTASPVAGAAGTALTVTPPVTTSYWARATSPCGGFIDTATIVVTVQACTAPVVLVQPFGDSVLSNHAATLNVAVEGAKPLSYQWYEGLVSDTSLPVPSGTDATLVTAQLFATTSYWVRITNACGTTDSAAATLPVVVTCVGHSGTVVEPRDQIVPIGSSAILTVPQLVGTSMTYGWFEGQMLDFRKPVGGNSRTLVTDPIDQQKQFWLYIYSPTCGFLDYTRAATITPIPRRRSAKE